MGGRTFIKDMMASGHQDLYRHCPGNPPNCCEKAPLPCFADGGTGARCEQGRIRGPRASVRRPRCSVFHSGPQGARRPHGSCLLPSASWPQERLTSGLVSQALLPSPRILDLPASPSHLASSSAGCKGGLCFSVTLSSFPVFPHEH